jgi:phage gpG-like protein
VEVMHGEVISPRHGNLKPYQKGKPPGPGRKAGIPNRITRVIKEAALLAFEQCGEPRMTETLIVGVDGKPVLKADGTPMMKVTFEWTGNDGLVGYIRHVAKHDYKAAMSLLAKILPLQIVATKHSDDEDEYESVDDVLDALRKKGYNADMVDHIATQVFAQKVTYKNRKDK